MTNRNTKKMLLCVSTFFCVGAPFWQSNCHWAVANGNSNSTESSFSLVSFVSLCSVITLPSKGRGGGRGGGEGRERVLCRVIQNRLVLSLSEKCDYNHIGVSQEDLILSIQKTLGSIENRWLYKWNFHIVHMCFECGRIYHITLICFQRDRTIRIPGDIMLID